MGEGVGVVILEEHEHAKARGAKSMPKLSAMACRAMRFTSHHLPKTVRRVSPMLAALKRSGLSPEDIGYVNAHGTSTPLGDEIELKAVECLFGGASDGLTMS